MVVTHADKISKTNPADAATSLVTELSEVGSNREHLYHLLFELMPGSVVLMDARGFVLDANPAFCRQIGFARTELIGGHVSRFSKVPLEKIEQNITRMMGGEVLEHEVTNVQKDGSLRHYELREAAITLPDGSRGILALANDITERLRVQQDRLEMERQLLHADKFKSLGVLAGGIAHDFNNLLLTITGRIELAVLDLPPKSPAQNQLQEAATAAHRAAELTRQLLAYSGRGQFVIENVDLSELIGGMSELLNASISKKASLRLKLASPLPFVKGDAPQLQHILLNLITNASEALTDCPGIITVATELRECDADYLAQSRTANRLAPGDYVALEVFDTGCGMDESVQERLFDPFFTTKFTGRGLGMSAVSGLVRGHQGGILVASRPGLGAMITVLFPVATDNVTPIVKPVAPPARKAEHSAGPLLHGTVLVADDEAPIRLLLEQILKRTGLRVLTARDGEEAVALFQERAAEITFVILDLTMPRMDGSRALVAMRRHRPEVKAVLISGYDAASIERRAQTEGFTAFIRKPFQVEALISLARQMCATEA